MPGTDFKTRLQMNSKVFGPFVRTNSPSVVECLGYAGFDFVIIDLEHSAMCNYNAEALIRAAEVTGIAPVVRVSCNEASLIQKVLDAGAVGVQVPQINNAADAYKAVKAAKYYPQGMRGVCRFVRSAQYSHMPKETYFSSTNLDTIVILQIEGEEGIRNIRNIIEVEGIDVIFIGPYDLSQSLGVTGQVESPVVIEQIKSLVSILHEKDIKIGSFVDNLESARKMAGYGITYLSTFIDTGLLYETSSQLVEKLKSLCN